MEGCVTPSEKVLKSWRDHARDEFLREHGLQEMAAYNYLRATERHIAEVLKKAGFPEGRL